MTGERFHWDWKTGRMKDTYSSFQATKDMRLIERQVNDACQSYEKQIAKLEKENEQLNERIEFIFKQIKAFREDCRTAQYFDGASTITQLIKILDVKE